MRLFFSVIFILWAVSHGLPHYGVGVVVIVGAVWFLAMALILMARKPAADTGPTRAHRWKRPLELTFAWALIALLIGSTVYATFYL